MTSTGLGQYARRALGERFPKVFGGGNWPPTVNREALDALERPVKKAAGRCLVIDNENKMLTISGDGRENTLPLFSREAFEAVSREWVRIGWSLRYYHTFSWQGRPILQLPEDLVRIQEVVVALKPDLIIETGIFDGGSMLFYASLCETLGKGRVLGIDIQLREEARQAVQNHALGGRIELHQGDSVSPATLAFVRSRIHVGEVVMVMLDSHHSHAHVAAELEAYAPLVTTGSCIVAADGIMRDLGDVPGGEAEWASDNPAGAAIEFASRHPEFELRQPSWHPNVSLLTANVTYWPDAWLWRRPVS